jgi:ABC-2 type transport system ATP-binding protein
MDEAERCGRVGYIYLSKLAAIGTIAELQQLPEANPKGTVRVQIDAPDASMELTRLRSMTGVREATIFGRSIHALVEQDDLDAIRQQLNGASVETIVPSLEDVFVTLTYEIMKERR